MSHDDISYAHTNIQVICQDQPHKLYVASILPLANPELLRITICKNAITFTFN